jgi:hypothetical protein
VKASTIEKLKEIEDFGGKKRQKPKIRVTIPEEASKDSAALIDKYQNASELYSPF